MNRPIASTSKIRKLRAAGWKVEDVGGNKLRWISPRGDTVFSGKHARDMRAIKNHEARLKRAAQPSTHAYN